MCRHVCTIATVTQHTVIAGFIRGDCVENAGARTTVALRRAVPAVGVCTAFLAAVDTRHVDGDVTEVSVEQIRKCCM